MILCQIRMPSGERNERKEKEGVLKYRKLGKVARLIILLFLFIGFHSTARHRSEVEESKKCSLLFLWTVNERNEIGRRRRRGYKDGWIALIWKTSKKSRPYRKPDPSQRRRTETARVRDYTWFWHEIRPNAGKFMCQGPIRISRRSENYEVLKRLHR